MTNLRSSPRGLDEIHPVARRVCGGRGHNLHNVAVAKLIFKRHYSPIDFGSDASEPHLCVNEEREVDRCRSPRQLNHLTLRSEAIDFLGIKIQFERIEKLARIFYFLLPLDQPLQPHKGFVFVRMRASPSFLVFPVCGDALFGD